MHAEISEEGADALTVYASVSIAYLMTEEVDVSDFSVVGGTPQLITRNLAHPTVKDYDAQPGNCPLDWPTRFDISRWGIFLARSRGQPIGGATISSVTDIAAFTGPPGLTVLWDIRIAPSFRRLGVGADLLTAAKLWALARGSTELIAETQNTNVAACRFYLRHGFSLRAVNCAAYAALPNEVQLLWYARLAQSRSAPAQQESDGLSCPSR